MTHDLLPLTVLLPETSAEPIVVYDQSAALRFAVAERAFVRNLGEEWDKPGNYILLDHPQQDGTWGVYVGKAAPGGVRSRLMSHLRNKDTWQRAVLVQRDTTYGFTSAHVGWLEGRLYDLFAVAEFAQLSNGNKPSDETLPPFDRASLEAAILPIRRLLRLIGYDPATPDDTAVVPTVRSNQPRGKRFYGVLLSSLIAAGVVPAGTRLTSTNTAWPATALVVPGGIEFEGRVYPSPSSAASAVKGGAANGWDFWAVETGDDSIPLATLRKRYQDAQTGEEQP